MRRRLLRRQKRPDSLWMLAFNKSDIRCKRTQRRKNMANLRDEIRSNDARDASVDMKLEVVVIPVSDVERAEQFYRRLGWRQDVTPPGSGVFQFTPHGSACSVHFGKGTSAAPGSAQRNYLIVSDIEAARNALVVSGVDVGEIFHITPDGPVTGLDPEHGTYRSCA